jgi:hypothetical protein
MLSFNFALAQGGDDGYSGGSGSGNSGGSGSSDSISGADDNSSSSSSSDLSSSSSDSSSDSGLEVETEHGVTFMVPHGVSGGDFFKTNFGADADMEVETEHGITFLKPHGSSTDESKIVGQSSEGMEMETEHGVSFLKPHGENRDASLESNVSGKILLQVQANGEAWWVDPVTKSKLFLGRPDDAFKIMRENGLGITNDDLNKIPSSEENKPASSLARQLSGRILLQVQSKGEAWYVNPVTRKRHFLGRPHDAFAIMRGLGLGITDDNLNRIRLKLGEVGKRKLEIALLPDNNSGQSGIAEITEMGSQVKVEVILSGAPAGSVQPSHIHVGNRPNLGAVKYPLNNVVDGVAETVLNVTFDKLLSERPLGINVHKSAAELSVYVASGNL